MRRILGLSISAIGAFAILYLRFSNSAMTETQLIMNYWFEFLVAAILLVLGPSMLSGKK